MPEQEEAQKQFMKYARVQKQGKINSLARYVLFPKFAFKDMGQPETVVVIYEKKKKRLVVEVARPPESSE